MKKILMILCFVITCVKSFAQNIEGVQMYASFSSATNVKELDVSKVAQVFGMPERIRQGMGEDGDICYTCFYGPSEKSDCLSFSDGKLVFYGLNTSRFLAATDMFDGGIRVGDSLSKVINAATYWENYRCSSIPNPENLLYSHGTYEAGGQEYTFIRVFRDGDDSFLMVKYSGNTITYIEFDYTR